MPTWRLFALLLLAAPFGALGGPFVLLAVAIAATSLAAAGVDWFLAGDGRRLRAERHLASDKLSLGAWNLVEIRLDKSQRSANTPSRCASSRPPTSSSTSPSSSRGLSRQGRARPSTYHVRPPRRGDARFGDLYRPLEGPLGLVRRTFRQNGTQQDVRVYPNLRELRRYDLLVRRGLEAQAAGRPVRVAGASTEFERVREYLPDDEFRRINWKATARRGAANGQPVRGRAQPEPGRAARRRSLDGRARRRHPCRTKIARPPALTKLDYALNAALLLAYVASLRGDRVALLAYADDVRAFVPPQRGRRALLATVQALYNLRAEPVEPDHGRAFGFLAQRNLRRSLVVLFTDLADRESSASAGRARAARRAPAPGGVRHPGRPERPPPGRAAPDRWPRPVRKDGRPATARRSRRGAGRPGRPRRADRRHRRRRAQPAPDRHVPGAQTARARCRRLRPTVSSSAIQQRRPASGPMASLTPIGRSLGETKPSISPAMTSTGAAPSSQLDRAPGGARQRFAAQQQAGS